MNFGYVTKNQLHGFNALDDSEPLTDPTVISDVQVALQTIGYGVGVTGTYDGATAAAVLAIRQLTNLAPGKNYITEAFMDKLYSLRPEDVTDLAAPPTHKLIQGDTIEIFGNVAGIGLGLLGLFIAYKVFKRKK